MNSKKQFVTMDELASGKLPNRIIDTVSQMEMSVEEVMDWQHSKPEFHAAISSGKFRIDIHKEYSLKKLFAVIASLIGTIWGIIQFVIPHLVK